MDLDKLICDYDSFFKELDRESRLLTFPKLTMYHEELQEDSNLEESNLVEELSAKGFSTAQINQIIIAKSEGLDFTNIPVYMTADDIRDLRQRNNKK